MFCWSSTVYSGQSACLTSWVVWSIHRMTPIFSTHWWCDDIINICKLSTYLSILTRMPPLWYLLEYYKLVLFAKTQFLSWIPDSEPCRIWTWISGTKSFYVNHWATLHWPSHQSFIYLSRRINLKQICFNLMSDIYSWNSKSFTLMISSKKKETWQAWIKL